MCLGNHWYGVMTPAHCVVKIAWTDFAGAIAGLIVGAILGFIG